MNVYGVMFLILAMSAVCHLSVFVALALRGGHLLGVLCSAIQISWPIALIGFFREGWGEDALNLLAGWTLAVSVVTLFIFFATRPKGALSVIAGILGVGLYAAGVFLLHNLP